MASCATGFAPVSIDHAAFPIFRSKLGTPVSAIERHVTDHSVLERKLHWAVRLKMRAARRLFPVLTETVRPIHHPEVRGAGAAKMALQASAVLGYRHGMSCAGGRFSPAIEDRLFPALLKVPVIQSMLCRPTARRRDDEIGLGEQFGGYLQARSRHMASLCRSRGLGSRFTRAEDNDAAADRRWRGELAF